MKTELGHNRDIIDLLSNNFSVKIYLFFPKFVSQIFSMLRPCQSFLNFVWRKISQILFAILFCKRSFVQKNEENKRRKNFNFHNNIDNCFVGDLVY